MLLNYSGGPVPKETATFHILAISFRKSGFRVSAETSVQMTLPRPFPTMLSRINRILSKIPREHAKIVQRRADLKEKIKTATRLEQEEAETRKRVKECPNCSRAVFKVEGCAAVTCKNPPSTDSSTYFANLCCLKGICGGRFCWVCGLCKEMCACTKEK